jgi:hypothetical protein
MGRSRFDERRRCQRLLYLQARVADGLQTPLRIFFQAAT